MGVGGGGSGDVGVNLVFLEGFLVRGLFVVRFFFWFKLIIKFFIGIIGCECWGGVEFDW